MQAIKQVKNELKNDLQEAYDMIKYWNSLSLEQYLEEDKQTRKYYLYLVFFKYGKISKPDFVKKFIKEKLEIIRDRKQQERIQKIVNWVIKNKTEFQIIRFTDKYICIGQEEAKRVKNETKFRYLKTRTINIEEDPEIALAVMKNFALCDNPKYENLTFKKDDIIKKIENLLKSKEKQNA